MPELPMHASVKDHKPHPKQPPSATTTEEYLYMKGGDRTPIYASPGHVIAEDQNTTYYNEVRTLVQVLTTNI